MEIEGKIIGILPTQTGTGKNGTWKKQEYIIETKGQYPKKVCVALWTEKIDQFPMALNEQVKLFVELESREFNSRWYTDVRVWKAEKLGASSDSYPPQPDILPPSSSESPADGDLPF